MNAPTKLALAACAAFAILSAPARAIQVDAIEYYHAEFDHYFLTAFPDEAAILDAGVTIQGWVRTGQTFKVDSTADAGFSEVCRFFSTNFAPKSSHFYTPLATECATVKTNPDWQYEGTAFYTLTPGANGACGLGLPVYRLYNNGQGGAPNHRYTTSLTIRAEMIAQGWIPEGFGDDGVMFCVSANDDGSTAYAQTARMVGGAWTIEFLIGTSIFTDKIPFVDIQTTPVVGSIIPWIAWGANEYGSLSNAGYSTNGGIMSLLSPIGATGASDFFTFQFTSNNNISGCAYFLATPSSSPTTCYTMLGVRVPPQ